MTLATHIKTLADGSVWFSESPIHQMGRWKNGALNHYPTTGATWPGGMVQDPDQNLWVLTDGKVIRMKAFPDSAPAGSPVTGQVLPPALPELAAANFDIVVGPGPEQHLWFTSDLGNRIGRIMRYCPSCGVQ